MLLLMAGSWMITSLTNKIRMAVAGLVGCQLILPSAVSAHLVTTGLGPVYDGIGHLLLTPEDLIPTLALSFYCGLRGARVSRYAMFMLPLAWFLGGLCGSMLEAEPAFPVSVISFLLLGLLVAGDIVLPLQVIVPLIPIVGFTHGLLNGLVLKSGPGIMGLLGIMGALFVIVPLAAAFVVSFERPWTRIVIRVMGSWVVASGMLMVGWYLKGVVKW